jgi:hypothetical protein
VQAPWKVERRVNVLMLSLSVYVLIVCMTQNPFNDRIKKQILIRDCLRITEVKSKVRHTHTCIDTSLQYPRKRLDSAYQCVVCAQ